MRTEKGTVDVRRFGLELPFEKPVLETLEDAADLPETLGITEAKVLVQLNRGVDLYCRKRAEKEADLKNLQKERNRQARVEAYIAQAQAGLDAGFADLKALLNVLLSAEKDESVKRAVREHNFTTTE